MQSGLLVEGKTGEFGCTLIKSGIISLRSGSFISSNVPQVDTGTLMAFVSKSLFVLSFTTVSTLVWNSLPSEDITTSAPIVSGSIKGDEALLRNGNGEIG